MNREISYIKNQLQKPIVIIGMMGAGKSHVGRKLAETLALDFYDSDRIIEEKAGRSISDIFQDFGEKKFRESEKSTILELLGCGPCVIATGGGAVTNPDTLREIKSSGVSVWLKADMETMLERLKNSKARPLLAKGDPEKILGDLMGQRQSLYSQADIVVETERDAISATLEKLIKALYGHINPASFQG